MNAKRKAEIRALRAPAMSKPYLNRRQLTLPDFTFIDFQPSAYWDPSNPQHEGKIEVYQFDYNSCLEMFVGYAEGELLNRVRRIFRNQWDREISEARKLRKMWGPIEGGWYEPLPLYSH